jgi:hypothetical protein
MTSPRRWFRFSLRALFLVVTVLACWLGWQANIVRERVAFRKRLSAGAGWSITAIDYAQIPSGPAAGPNDPTGRIPFWRRWMGDEAIGQIGFERGANDEERARARELFPEAYVSDR